VEVQLSWGSWGTFRGEVKGVELHWIKPIQGCGDVKNYTPVVLPDFHDNWLYAEPTAEQWSKVKVEKSDGSEFWAVLKAKKTVEYTQLGG
jgi:hypothetical protein